MLPIMHTVSHCALVCCIPLGNYEIVLPTVSFFLICRKVWRYLWLCAHRMSQITLVNVLHASLLWMTHTTKYVNFSSNRSLCTVFCVQGEFWLVVQVCVSVTCACSVFNWNQMWQLTIEPQLLEGRNNAFFALFCLTKLKAVMKVRILGYLIHG